MTSEMMGMENGCVCRLDTAIPVGAALQIGTNGQPQFVSPATMKITPPAGYTSTTLQALLNEIAAKL